VICEEERQYVNWSGQQWTTLTDLRRTQRNLLKPQGNRIIGIGSTPKFAIGQRALLVQTSEGNVHPSPAPGVVFESANCPDRR
jgi:hypothetical protein